MDMETKRFENNQVTISGEIVSNFEFRHKVCGERLYTAQLASKRMGGVKDIIPVMVSERLVDVKADWMGQTVQISGQFRSYNKHEENKNHCILSVFAREFNTLSREVMDDKNKIFLDGYICKKPNYRETPLGREICDILLAVNRHYGKSDYIPCIAWGRNAVFAGGLEVGTRLQIEGRIQSREYQKKISDTEFETRTSYEVSASKLEVIEDEQEENNA